MEFVGSHTWKHEVKRWAAPIDFDAWRQAACGSMSGDHLPLREYYDACWDPLDCREYLLVNQLLRAKPKRRIVVLDVDEINRRFALCLWRECSALLTRNMTPEARQLVCDMRAKMQVQAGIEVFGESGS